ncbi:hypothetical protein [Simiduia agarivorans]|uniref:Uncharacterized protein n=1 Tax=Simiduia agarivorans (strain DSM 21679 / JCM 13881 / BCRC 17597 / SA1) TaxID=1117647 RepID=K4KW03_SIMAS|nr:hypothetical protein [Simiduia agarivorans]AFU98112.1 hypothetical protein M5M_04525 [Simiduia agarivorans SA1 = DSM 21679]
MIYENLQQSLVNAIGRYPVEVAASRQNLDVKVRQTLSKMRERMNNMEQVLGRTADENAELKSHAVQLETRLQLVSNANYLAAKREQELKAQVLDLEAQLAVYRRQATADKKEIEALKDQLFA